MAASPGAATGKLVREHFLMRVLFAVWLLIGIVGGGTLLSMAEFWIFGSRVPIASALLYILGGMGILWIVQQKVMGLWPIDDKPKTSFSKRGSTT